MCEGKVNGKPLLSEKEKVINVGKVWRVVGLLGGKKTCILVFSGERG